MDTARLEYDLPEELIAQRPADKRDGSRLMVLHRHDRTIEHRTFSDIAEYLRKGDLLVLNDSRVLPARLAARRATGGKIDILLVSEIRDDCWTAMVSPGGRLKEGELLTLPDGRSVVRVGKACDGFRELLFEEGANAFDVMNRLGRAPLPPYIRRKTDDPDVTAEDLERYQTVYAEVPGSIAAPTAGLHFTESILSNLREMGVGVASVTLHVGAGTFLPIRSDTIEDHIMHTEYYRIPDETMNAIEQTKQGGGRVVCVGTTACRALETAEIRPGSRKGRTDLFIRPPFEFAVTDALVTNFHLPRSTLLLLVYALAGEEFVRSGYAEAVREKYRFYSYGDATLIL